MNRIDKLFKEKKENILSVYFTAGYPKTDDTIEVIKTLEKNGVDLLEIECHLAIQWPTVLL